LLTPSVKQAKAAFLKNVKAKYPNIKESDLEIKVSNEVEKMEQDRRKAWRHPENLIPVGEIEGVPFVFGTPFDDFIPEEMLSEDVFDDDAFGFGMMFERPPFPGAAHLGNTADSRSALADDMATFLRISRPAAPSTLSRTAGDRGAGPSTGERRQNAAASSSRTQTRAVAGSSRQPNDVATSRSRAPATTIASSSRTVSSRPSNSSRVADRTTVAPNNPQRSDSTSARLRATTAQTSSGVLNPNRRTGTGVTIGQPATPHMGRGTSTTRTSRVRRGNSVGRSNAQRLASMTTPSMFENDFYPAGIYGRPYGYGHEDVFEDLYYDDPYEYGYYGSRRYY